MGKPQSLLEGLSGHALGLGADSLKIEFEEGYEIVYARRGHEGISIARYKSNSTDAKELRENLYAAAKKPLLTVLNGERSILSVRIRDSFGEDAFDVAIKKAPALDPAAKPSFTARQGQYLAYIHYYSKIHRRAPSEADLQEFFRVSPPSVHDMIKILQRNGFIDRTPGEARSIRLAIPPESLPPLE